MKRSSSKKLNPHKVGLTLGILVGSLHLLWMMVVALGAGKAALDWIFGLHHLNNPFSVYAFGLGTAVMLVVMAVLSGYVLGAVFALLWNWLGKRV